MLHSPKVLNIILIKISYLHIIPSAEEEEEEEEEGAEDSGVSDEEVGLDYLTKDIGSVRTTINEFCTLSSSL